MKFDAFGDSELRIIKSSQGWYVGYYHQEDDGTTTQYRMSGHFPCHQAAEAVLAEVLADQKQLVAA